MGAVMEEWKAIKGYEGAYSVSNLGRVMAHRRSVAFGNTVRMTREHVLSQKDNGTGYLKVSLNIGNKRKSMFVHRLVADAFLEKPVCGKYEVNHIDYNKHNNEVSNLEWVTRADNIKHSIQHWSCRHAEKTLTGERYIGLRNNTYRVTVGGDKTFKTIDEAIAYRNGKCKELGIDIQKGVEKKCQRKRSVFTNECTMDCFA